MFWSIDRIIENIAILENITSGEIKEVSLERLPDNVHDGNIVKEDINGNYVLDEELERKRRNDIRERFNKLKN